MVSFLLLLDIICNWAEKVFAELEFTIRTFCASIVVRLGRKHIITGRDT